VHAASQSAGVPILAAAYVAVTLAAVAVTFFEDHHEVLILRPEEDFAVGLSALG
jgi:hypothetical protein